LLLDLPLDGNRGRAGTRAARHALPPRLRARDANFGYSPPMEKILGLRCVECGKSYREDEVLYTCPACTTGETFGILDVEYDYDRQARVFHKDHLSRAEHSLWRYLPILPIKDDARLPS